MRRGEVSLLSLSPHRIVQRPRVSSTSVPQVPVPLPPPRPMGSLPSRPILAKDFTFRNVFLIFSFSKESKPVCQSFGYLC